jgi:hypothetical protein
MGLPNSIFCEWLEFLWRMAILGTGRKMVRNSFVLSALTVLFLVVPGMPMVMLAEAQTARIEIRSFDTVTLTDAQFLMGSKEGTRAQIGGELRLPSGVDRFPAVVLVHSCGGVGANVDRWAQELNGIGVAAFLVDRLYRTRHRPDVL